MNKRGGVSIVFRFDRAEPFSGGLALVEFEGKKRFIDAKRNFAFSKCFADADSFSVSSTRQVHESTQCYFDFWRSMEVPTALDMRAVGDRNRAIPANSLPSICRSWVCCAGDRTELIMRCSASS